MRHVRMKRLECEFSRLAQATAGKLHSHGASSFPWWLELDNTGTGMTGICQPPPGARNDVP